MGPSQDLHRERPPFPTRAWKEALRDHGAYRVGELHADLLLPLARVRVDDAFDRPGRAPAMEAREHEVPCLGGGEREAYGLGITHSADEQDVRVLAEGVAEACREIPDVAADFGAGGRGPSSPSIRGCIR